MLIFSEYNEVHPAMAKHLESWGLVFDYHPRMTPFYPSTQRYLEPDFIAWIGTDYTVTEGQYHVFECKRDCSTIYAAVEQVKNYAMYIAGEPAVHIAVPAEKITEPARRVCRNAGVALHGLSILEENYDYNPCHSPNKRAFWNYNQYCHRSASAGFVLSPALPELRYVPVCDEA